MGPRRAGRQRGALTPRGGWRPGWDPGVRADSGGRGCYPPPALTTPPPTHTQVKGEAQAFAIEAKARADAEQMSKKAEAFQQYQDAAMVDMLLEKLPQVRPGRGEGLIGSLGDPTITKQPSASPPESPCENNIPPHPPSPYRKP